MAAYSVVLSTVTVAELAEYKLDRTRLVLTFMLNDASNGVQGMIISDDGDPTAVGSWPGGAGRRAKGMVFQAWNGPLVIEGEAARRRWTALANAGAPLVGVMEHFDTEDKATPTAKPPETESGIKV